MTEAIKQALPKLVPLLVSLPTGQHVDIEQDVDEIKVSMQCWTQSEAKAARRCFPGAIWLKHYEAGDLNWWEYFCEWSGLKVKIYACREAPPTCRMEKRIVEVEERVPTQFETRTVEREIIEWKCDGEEAGHDA